MLELLRAKSTPRCMTGHLFVPQVGIPRLQGTFLSLQAVDFQHEDALESSQSDSRHQFTFVHFRASWQAWCGLPASNTQVVRKCSAALRNCNHVKVLLASLFYETPAAPATKLWLRFPHASGVGAADIFGISFAEWIVQRQLNRLWHCPGPAMGMSDA